MHKTYNPLGVVVLIVFIAVILLMSHDINQLDFTNGVCIIKESFSFSTRVGRKENRKIWDQYDRYKHTTYRENEPDYKVESVVGHCKYCPAERASDASRLNHIITCPGTKKLQYTCETFSVIFSR